MIDSRDINQLNATVRDMCRAHIEAARADGIDLLVTSTHRDAAMQAKLYEIGRTTIGVNPRPGFAMGNVVTNARPGESWHQYRVAYDVVPIVYGKPVWDDPVLWKRVGELGEGCGLEWAGRWKSFRETAHFQYTGGRTLAQLIKDGVTA